MFSNREINLDLLKKRAFNLRWAAVEEGVIPLTAADPDFPCAPQIVEAIGKFSSDRYFSYAPAEGYDFFKEAVAKFYFEKRKIPAKPQWVLPVDSAAFGIFAVCKALLQPNEEAIVFNPVDFLFAYSVEACGAKAVRMPVSFEPQQEIDYQLLEELITPKTRLICLCNPLNPTGKVFREEELEKIGKIAQKHHLFILSDEIWSDIVFNPVQYVSIASISEEIRNLTIIVTGYSKSYGLAGLRVGSILAPSQNLYDRILLASDHQSTIHGCNALAQVAAASALNDCGDWLNKFVEHLTNIRNIIVPGLNEIPGFQCHIPEGCYLAFPDISRTGLTATAMQEILYKEAKVAVVPGLPKWFGDRAEGHIRLSFATSSELVEEALFRIKKTIEKK